MNFRAFDSSDWNKLFSPLYDDHDVYLDLSDIKNQLPQHVFRQTNYIQSVPKQNLSMSKNQIRNSKSAEDHLKYLKYLQVEYEKRNNAAKKIQKYWYRYKFRLIYFRLRDLIKRCAKLEPSLALRSVNPREASLIDIPSGSIVKFKLAGTNFPPRIVYKIVSVRPITRVHSYTPHHMQHLMYMAYKKNEFNDWRLYEKNDDYTNVKRDQSKKSAIKRPKSIAKTIKNGEMSWVKNFYSV